MSELALTLSLGPAFPSADATRRAAENGLAAGIDSLCETLAVPAQASVGAPAMPDEGAFPASFSIGGQRMPITWDALARAIGAASEDWAPPLGADEVGARLVTLEPDEVAQTMLYVAHELVGRCPAVLLGPDEAARLGEECGCPATDRVLTIGRRLLEMRLSLADRDALHAAARRTDVSAEDAAEELIARLRADRISVLVEPDLLRAITLAADTEELRARYGSVRRQIFFDFGLVASQPRFRAAPELAPGMAAYEIGQLRTVPFRIPVAGEVLVIGEPTPEDAGAIRTRTIAWELPAHVLPATRRPELARRGTLAWEGLELTAVELHQAVRRYGAALVDMTFTEARLQLLQRQYPKIHDALALRFSRPELTRLLRSLVRSQISIANLPTIAQAMIDDPDHAERNVRRRLAPTATARITGGTNAFDAIVLDPSHENRIVAAAGTPERPPDDLLAQRLPDAIAKEFARLGQGSGYACVVTDERARPAVAAALRASHPDLLVASWAEVPASMNVCSVMRLPPER